MKKVQYVKRVQHERNAKWNCASLRERNIEKVQHEKSAIRKKCSMEIVQHKKCATWKECNAKKEKHGNSARWTKCNMKKYNLQKEIWKKNTEIIHYGAQTDNGPSVEGLLYIDPGHMASTSYYFLLLTNILLHYIECKYCGILVFLMSNFFIVSLVVG